MEEKVKKVMVADTRPSFFKILHPSLPSHHLRIPPYFMQYISEDMSDKAFLEGPCGERWEVEIAKTQDGFMYLEGGWQSFLRDNRLGDSEFLVFIYDGKMCFHVQIFDRNGCERHAMSVFSKWKENHPKRKGKEAQVPVSVPVPVMKRKRGRPRKHPVDVPQLSPSRSPEDGADQHLQDNDIEKKIKIEEEQLSINEIDSQSQKLKGGKSAIREIETEAMSLRTQKIYSQPEYEVPKSTNIKKEMDARTMHDSAREGPTTAGEKGGVQIQSEPFKSKYPCFEAYMKKSHLNKKHGVFIPVSFSQLHLPRCKIDVVLQTSGGEEWKVNLSPYRGTHAIWGGWSSFVRDNNLNIGDTCTFELSNENKMKVHISRYGDKHGVSDQFPEQV